MDLSHAREEIRAFVQIPGEGQTFRAAAIRSATLAKSRERARTFDP
jgi:hypothetical protein